MVSYFTETRPKVRLEKKQTCHGENLSPSLSWSKAPNGTVSFALIAEDLDHETGSWVHWVVYNIPGDVTKLAAGIPTSTSKLLDGTTQGSNDHKRIGYEGPSPPVIIIGYHNDYSGANPTQTLPHRYVFTLYALQTEINLDPGSDKKQLLESMDGKILAQANTTGKFQVAPTTERAKDHGRSSLNIIRGKGTSTLATSTSK